MEQKLDLIDLTDAFHHLLDEINAVEVMAYGLAHVKDPYADGFGALYDHLRESTNKMQELLEKING